MTDHNAEIAKQLKRIADALERMAPKRDDTFVQPYVPPVTPYPPSQPWWNGRTWTTTGPGTATRGPLVEGEGDYLLNPDADHTGEETE